MDKINNKNAREKALLEEAYGNVYKEGQFWGRDDLVKKGKEEDIARGAVKLVGKTKGGNYTSAILPKGDPKIEELEAQGYKREPIEDEQNPDADTYDAQGEEPAEMVSLNRNEEEEYIYTADDLKDIHDVIERVYEISGYLAEEIGHLQVVEDDVPFARWNNLKTLQKDLSNIFDTVATEEDWHRESESRRLGAEPRSGGYHEF